MNHVNVPIAMAAKEYTGQVAQETGPYLDRGCADAAPDERTALRERLDLLNQDELCNTLRGTLGDIERSIRRLYLLAAPGERRDQAALAVRHVEDARMRLGKVIQHGSGGGKSIYDR